jgi:hypothetical protein
MNSVPISLNQFRQVINQLIINKKIFSFKGYYLLYNSPSLVKNRINSQKTNLKKTSIARNIARILSFIPTIEFIGLTGAVAIKNAGNSDDIDILIITRNRTLWISRFLVVIVLDFIGIRRKPNDDKFNNKICVNMFLDVEHLQIPSNERDIYSAHEITQMKVLYDRGNNYIQFLKENRWIKEYLPNSVIDTKILRVKDNKRKKNRFVSWYLSILVSLFEPLAKQFQFRYMRKRITSEVIKDGYLRFHPQDGRKWIIPEYDRLVEKYASD